MQSQLPLEQFSLGKVEDTHSSTSHDCQAPDMLDRESAELDPLHVWKNTKISTFHAIEDYIEWQWCDLDISDSVLRYCDVEVCEVSPIASVLVLAEKKLIATFAPEIEGHLAVGMTLPVMEEPTIAVRVIFMDVEKEEFSSELASGGEWYSSRALPPTIIFLTDGDTQSEVRFSHKMQTFALARGRVLHIRHNDEKPLIHPLMRIVNVQAGRTLLDPIDEQIQYVDGNVHNSQPSKTQEGLEVSIIAGKSEQCRQRLRTDTQYHDEKKQKGERTAL